MPKFVRAPDGTYFNADSIVQVMPLQYPSVGTLYSFSIITHTFGEASQYNCEFEERESTMATREYLRFVNNLS